MTGCFSSFCPILSPVVYRSPIVSGKSLIHLRFYHTFAHSLASSLSLAHSLAPPPQFACGLSRFLITDLFSFPVTVSSAHSQLESFLIPPFVFVSYPPLLLSFIHPSLSLFRVCYCAFSPFVLSDRPLPLIDSDGRLKPTP